MLTGLRGPTESLDVLGVEYAYSPLVVPFALAAAGVAAAVLALAAIRATGVRRLALSAAVVGLTAVALVQVPDTAPARPLVVALALAATAFGLVDLTARAAAWSWAQVGVVALPFAGAAVAVLTADDAQRTLALLDGLALIPVATVGLGLAVVVSLGSTLQTRHERVDRLLTHPRRRSTVWAVVALKVVLLAALYLGLFGEALGGPAMWRPRTDQPLSWLHAAAVAATVVAVVARGARQPLESRGFGPRLLVLAGAAALGHAAFLLATAAAFAVLALAPTVDVVPILTIGEWAIDHVELLQLVVAVGVLGLSAGALLLRHPWTTGLALWLVAGVWLVPPTLGIWLTSIGRLGEDVTFWAAPGQVDAALTITVACLALRKRRLLEDRLLLRLLIVPPVVVVGGSLLPEAWTSEQARLLVVTAVVLALTVRAPRLELDPRSYERTVGTLAATNLLLLAAYGVIPVETDLEAALGADGTIALMWLAIPVAGVLVADSRPRELPGHALPRPPIRQRWARSRQGP